MPLVLLWQNRAGLISISAWPSLFLLEIPCCISFSWISQKYSVIIPHNYKFFYLLHQTPMVAGNFLFFPKNILLVHLPRLTVRKGRTFFKCIRSNFDAFSSGKVYERYNELSLGRWSYRYLIELQQHEMRILFIQIITGHIIKCNVLTYQLLI